jgi:hypothetical protein
LSGYLGKSAEESEGLKCAASNVLKKSLTFK